MTHREKPHRWVVLLAFALGGIACSDSALVTAPQPSPLTTPLQNSSVVQGTVIEHTMSVTRPLSGVRLQVFKSIGFTTEVLDVISRADGSYEAGEAVWGPSFVFVRIAPGSMYLSPCPPFTWSAQRLDVHVVSAALLSSTGTPPSFQKNPTNNFHAVISGRVFERAAGGTQGVAGASVALDSGSETLSNASGQYLLCAVGNSDHNVTVRASKDGYAPVAVEGVPYFGWDLDFELTHR